MSKWTDSQRDDRLKRLFLQTMSGRERQQSRSSEFIAKIGFSRASRLAIGNTTRAWR